MIFKLILIILHICDTNVHTFTILLDVCIARCLRECLCPSYRSYVLPPVLLNRFR